MLRVNYPFFAGELLVVVRWDVFLRKLFSRACSAPFSLLGVNGMNAITLSRRFFFSSLVEPEPEKRDEL